MLKGLQAKFKNQTAEAEMAETKRKNSGQAAGQEMCQLLSG